MESPSSKDSIGKDPCSKEPQEYRYKENFQNKMDIKKFFEQKKKEKKEKEVLWIIGFDNDIKLLIPAPDSIEGLLEKMADFNVRPQALQFDSREIVQGSVYYTYERKKRL